MATSGPASTEVDSPLAQSRNPTPAKLLSASDLHGFRPPGHAAGQVGADSIMSLSQSRPGSGLPVSQAHASVPHQSTPLQQHMQQGGGSQSVGHFPVSNSIGLQSQHSPHLSMQQRPQQITGTGGNLRQQQQSAQVIPVGLSSKLSRSQVQISRQTPQDGLLESRTHPVVIRPAAPQIGRQTPQDGLLESRAHPVVTRPVANMGQLQGGPAAMGGGHLGKTQLLLQRPQGSPQDKGGLAQKPNSVQRQGMQRVHPRPGWQPPSLGQQHAQGTPSGQSRMFYQHPVLNLQPRTTTLQEQGRQHSAVVAIPQQFVQQQPTRDAGATGSKSMPIYPVLRTPAAGNLTINQSDTGYRERACESQIIVHIGDRKVRLLSESDPSSLYSLCRRWVRNDVPRTDRPGLRDTMNIPLPRPLSVSEVENAEIHALENGIKSDADRSRTEVEKPLHLLTEEELLQSHVQHFKTVRKRSREERMRRIARFKPRLALLLPSNNESS